MFLRTIPRSLNILAVIALAILLIKIFIFNNLPEAFDGAFKLGLIAEGVLASVLASYVFYIIVVHMKEVNDKKIIYPHVMKWAKYVVNDCKYQLRDFSNESEITLEFKSLDLETLQEAFTKIRPQDDAPLYIRANNYANWFQYFHHHVHTSRKNIAKIMSQLLFLDADFVALVTKIDDCSHFAHPEIAFNKNNGNKDLSSYSKGFFEYYEYCYELDRYLNNNLDIYDN